MRDALGRRAPKREEGREQRKERREKREERKWPQARFTAFLQCPRRAGWWRKGSGPRREDGRAQGEALTAARKDHARKLKAALLDGLKKEESREKREERKWQQSRFTAFLQCPRRAGWRRKGSGPRREDGRAQGEALTAARKGHARKHAKSSSFHQKRNSAEGSERQETNTTKTGESQDAKQYKARSRSRYG